VLAANITDTSATISWSTDEESTGQVEYGLTTAYGSISSLDEDLITNHSVILSGLEPDTIYHYCVKSEDASGNEAISVDNTFVTPDTVAPTISDVMVSHIMESSVTISWNTDESATSQVEYGTSITYDSIYITYPDVLVTNHNVSLSGLEPGTEYHFKVKSKDNAANETSSEDDTFTTPDTPPNIPSGLEATRGYKEARLSWVANSESDLAGYNLYKSLSADGAYTKVNSSLITSTSYLDTGLIPNSDYYYKLSAIDEADNESELSDALHVKTSTFEEAFSVTLYPSMTIGGYTYSLESGFYNGSLQAVKVTKVWIFNAMNDIQADYTASEIWDEDEYQVNNGQSASLSISFGFGQLTDNWYAEWFCIDADDELLIVPGGISSLS